MSQPGCSFSEELHSRSEVYEHKKEMTTSGAGLLGSMFSGLNECSIQIAPQSMVVNIMQSPQSQSTGKWLSLWTLGSITWTPVVLVHYCDNYLLWLIPTSKKNLKGYIKAWALAAEYLPVGYHSCQMLLFTWSILYHVNFWGAAIASLQIGLFLRTISATWRCARPSAIWDILCSPRVNIYLYHSSLWRCNRHRQGNISYISLQTGIKSCRTLTWLPHSETVLTLREKLRHGEWLDPTEGKAELRTFAFYTQLTLLILMVRFMKLCVIAMNNIMSKLVAMVASHLFNAHHGVNTIYTRYCVNKPSGYALSGLLAQYLVYMSIRTPMVGTGHNYSREVTCPRTCRYIPYCTRASHIARVARNCPKEQSPICKLAIAAPQKLTWYSIDHVNNNIWAGVVSGPEGTVGC